jgi:Predicted transcriptional regulators
MSEIKDRIKTERLKMKLYQQDLADKLKVSKQAVSHWETGQRTPDAVTLKGLADLFNVTTDYLLCRTDNPNELKQAKDIDELNPELKSLLANAKDLPVEVINNINNMITNWKETYKLFTTKIEGKDIKYILDTEKKPKGLTPDEELIMYKLAKRIQEIRKNK